VRPFGYIGAQVLPPNLANFSSISRIQEYILLLLKENMVNWPPDIQQVHQSFYRISFFETCFY